MNRIYASVLTALALGGIAFGLSQCDGAACGNGIKEGSEQCDNGKLNGTAGNGCSAECKLVSIPRASLQVFVQRLKDEAPGYSGADVASLGIDHSHVVVNGPTPQDATWPANKNSDLYTNIMAGDYTATVTLFDASGNALTKAVTTTMGHVDVPNTLTLTVNFHQADFLKQDYTGTLYVDPNWGMTGGSCSGASPMVQMESFKVTKPDNTPVTGFTLDGKTGTMLHNMDGTYGACFSRTTDSQFEKVPMMPWGHYKITIVGKIAGGTVGYCQKFDDVFVGPGILTPTYELVVPAADADMGPCP
jgi:cysteine-rich repeat protein